MKIVNIKKSLTTLTASLFAIVALFIFNTGQAQAVQIPYEDIGNVSFQDPVFNTYTNVPNGVGNEADFVRIRPSTGDVSDNGQGGVRNALYVNGQAAQCNVGEKFDIRTYIHNGADDDYNDNGNGSSVAHETNVRMVAPFSTAGQTLTFTSTISAKDVSPVTDTARLYCKGGEDVMLKLVPNSVKVYSSQYGYKNVGDNAVNGVLPIGSRVPGSGDVWGCWADRVYVAYIVEVVEMPKVEEPVYSCDLLTAVFVSDKKYRFTANASAKNGAVIKEYAFDFGDNTTVVKTDKNVVEHTYAKTGTYKIKVTVTVEVNGETKTTTSENCEAKVSFDTKADVTPTTPTTLPNTGAGSVAGILAAVTAAGALAHRKLTLRRQ